MREKYLICRFFVYKTENLWSVVYHHQNKFKIKLISSHSPFSCLFLFLTLSYAFKESCRCWGKRREITSERPKSLIHVSGSVNWDIQILVYFQFESKNKSRLTKADYYDVYPAAIRFSLTNFFGLFDLPWPCSAEMNSSWCLWVRFESCQQHRTINKNYWFISCSFWRIMKNQSFFLPSSWEWEKFLNNKARLERKRRKANEKGGKKYEKCQKFLNSLF